MIVDRAHMDELIELLAATEKSFQDAQTRADNLQRALDDPATELGQVRAQLAAVHDVVDHWLDLHRVITPAALPTIRLTAAVAELLPALGADPAEVQQLLDQARATEQANPRPRSGSELADRDATILRLARRVIDLEDELVDAWHEGHRTSEPLREVLGMTKEQYATWASGRPEQAATCSLEASSSEQVGGTIRASSDRQAPLIAAEQGHGHCHPLTVPNAPAGDITVRVHGSGELTKEGRQALRHLVRAAVDQFAADQPEVVPVLAAVGDALTSEASTRGLLVRQAAQQAGIPPAVASRILQGAADRVTVAELARIATWIGLDLTTTPRTEENHDDDQL